MTLVSPPAADIREGTSRRTDRLHQRACAAFESCATAAPSALSELASAFAEYLYAWHETSASRLGFVDPMATRQRLDEQVARLDGVLRRAEQTVMPSESPPTPSSLDLTEIEDEAARFLAEIRDLLRCLDAGRPGVQRVRLALLAAWGRYDDALAALRRGVADPTVMAGVRDALVQRLETARSVSTQADQAAVNGAQPSP